MDHEHKAHLQANFRLATVLTILVIGFGTIFYHVVEDLRVIDAFYFSVISLATVGYGDITPRTDLGKIFTAFYVIGGIGIIGTYANLLIRRAAMNRSERVAKRAKKQKQEQKIKHLNHR